MNEKEVVLTLLLQGQQAEIVRFTNEDIFLKLMEMGCVPGEFLEVTKKAPFNDPISIRIADYTLSLRKDEAMHIVVRPIYKK